MSAALDTLMDRTVLAGYSRVGYRIRSRGWSAGEVPGMDGKVVVVTGATSGLGLAAAERLARLGATVWLGVRNPHRGEATRSAIAKRTGSRDVHLGMIDLSSLRSVRQFAGQLRDRLPRLDVLINNAGVLTQERKLSSAGIEMTLATNVIGPFLLTGLLAPLLEAGRNGASDPPGRVVNVSSGGMYTQKLRTDDLQSERGSFDGPTAYARSKRAQLILTELWAERLAGRGVVVHAMHPGWVDTPGLRTSLPRFYKATETLLRTPEEGADTIVWLAGADAPAQSSGGFWQDRRLRPTYLLPWTKETPGDRVELWAQCLRLSGWESS